MKKKNLFFMFLAAVMLCFCLGLGQMVYSAEAPDRGQGDNNKITLGDWGASFQLPSSKWSAIGEFNNQKAGKTIFSYRGEALTDKAGTVIMPNISFIFEKVSDMNINTYSTQAQTQVPIKIKNKFTAVDNLISLKNAVGYIGVSKDLNGIEHTIVLVHALSSGKGMQVIMDITTELYPKVKGEFTMVLKSLRFK